MKKELDIDVNWISPIEEHTWELPDGGSVTMMFKRDDKFAPFGNGVNGGKARQATDLLRKNKDHIKQNCKNTVITSTSVDSPQGIIITTVAHHFNMESKVVYGLAVGERRGMIDRNPLVNKIHSMGGKVMVIANASYPKVIDGEIDKIISRKESPYFTIKFGINASKNEESIFGVISNQVINDATFPKDLDTLIIPVGSGLIFSGILMGLAKRNIKPKRIIGVLSGMDSTNNIRSILDPLGIVNIDDTKNGISFTTIVLKYELVRTKKSYHEKIYRDVPFNIDPIYEAKTLLWCEEQYQNGGLDTNQKNMIWIVGNQREMINANDVSAKKRYKQQQHVTKPGKFEFKIDDVIFTGELLPSGKIRAEFKTGTTLAALIDGQYHTKSVRTRSRKLTVENDIGERVFKQDVTITIKVAPLFEFVTGRDTNINHAWQHIRVRKQLQNGVWVVVEMHDDATSGVVFGAEHKSLKDASKTILG